MFDDTQYLKKEYEEAVKAGLFVKDSTIENIIAHEAGHVIDHKTQDLYQKVFGAISEQAEISNMTVFLYHFIASIGFFSTISPLE